MLVVYKRARKIYTRDEEKSELGVAEALSGNGSRGPRPRARPLLSHAEWSEGPEDRRESAPRARNRSRQFPRCVGRDFSEKLRALSIKK